jgi:hypothetical protein
MTRLLPLSFAALTVAVAGIANADKLGLGKASTADKGATITAKAHSENSAIRREMPKNDDYQSIMRRAGGGGSSPSCCPADFDCNGIVDASDLATLLGSWGPCSGCQADINQDGQVDASDLATLLGSWGVCVG